MSCTIACIAGEAARRLIHSGQLRAESIGPRPTPFGDSGEIFQANGETPYYILTRLAPKLAKCAPRNINDRANLYALKDLGAGGIVAWGAGGAVSHDVAIGDVVLATDALDFTTLRRATFYPDSPLGYLRQFPLFCPALRAGLVEALAQTDLHCHEHGTAAVCEGPRYESAAEVRMLSSLGARVVTHSFLPEASLAKELQMCYAAVCYVVNYAETGSRHQPLGTGDLFGGISKPAGGREISHALAAMGPVTSQLASQAATRTRDCGCGEPMAQKIAQYDLPADWHEWLTLGG